MSYGSVSKVKSYLNQLDTDLDNNIVSDAEIEAYLTEQSNMLDGSLSHIYQVPILEAQAVAFSIVTMIVDKQVANIVYKILNSQANIDNLTNLDYFNLEELNSYIEKLRNGTDVLTGAINILGGQSIKSNYVCAPDILNPNNINRW